MLNLYGLESLAREQVDRYRRRISVWLFASLYLRAVAHRGTIAIAEMPRTGTGTACLPRPHKRVFELAVQQLVIALTDG